MLFFCLFCKYNSFYDYIFNLLFILLGTCTCEHRLAPLSQQSRFTQTNDNNTVIIYYKDFN